jgi:hydrogenase expression/formation protein HypC
MCLAIPMQISHIDGYNAKCAAKGVQREVSLFLLQDDDLQIGDYVLIHVGYAIQKISEQDAHTAWELFDEMYLQEVASA